MSPRNVPIPALMKHLPLDKRGYPTIPLVMKDENGPKFAVNNEEVRQRFLVEDRCGVCGNKLYRARWLVGGPGSAFLENGAYIDPPMHGECMHYALKVCPYLAAPRYAGGLGKKQAASYQPGEDRERLVVLDARDSLFPERPKLFVAVQYLRADIQGGIEGLPVIVPKQPFRQMEYWVEGIQLSPTEGALLSGQIVAEMQAVVEEAGA